MANAVVPQNLLSIDQITKIYYEELTFMARKNRRISSSNSKNRTTLLFNKNLSSVNLAGMFSQKVFVGGAPAGVSDSDVYGAFSKFGNFTIEKKKANEKSSFFYIIYDSSQCVKSLLTSCVINNVGEFYTRIANHIVQVIPWEINNSHYVPASNMTLLDNKKVVFIGGLHGKMTAKFIAEVFSYFGPIVMVTIDVDKYKYPIGSGRVAFSDNQGYFTAIMQEFIDIETPDFRKTVQVTPQLEDSLCHVCKGEVGPFFCKDFSCYQYYCTLCWKLKHSGPGFMHHQPLIRDSKHKPKLGPILSKFAALTFK